jgi:hypothetical protein
MNELFPNCSYFHVTFTVPSQFRALLFEKRSLLNAVFSACTETLLSFCAEQGFLPAITAVLHTFGSDLKRHIHVHVIISAGGLKLSFKAERFTRFIKRKMKDPSVKQEKPVVVMDDPEWIPWIHFPFDMLRLRYQAILINHLKDRILDNLNSEKPDPELKPFSDDAFMEVFFDDLKKEYVNGFYVNITGERVDLRMTAGYIGRYARRPPLSELRIKDYTGEMVTFEFKDYRDGEKKSLYTLRTVEFIRKLIRHIPPHYFNLIRHYGLMASRVKGAYKAITDKLLKQPPTVQAAQDWRERQTAFRGKDPLICTVCRKVMQFVSAYLPNPLSEIKARLQAAFP